MIGAPLALLGLLAVAVPVLIHLLGRHQSRIQRFPTLRFIPVSRLAPTRRRRISDWPLLLVRCAVVGAAALALSQPYFPVPGRSPASPSRVINRAIVVDTSLSMRRPSGTTRAIDSARALAETASDAVASTTIETDDLRHGIQGALAWLSDRRGIRELMVVSDFQGGMVGWWDGRDRPGRRDCDRSAGGDRSHITRRRGPPDGVRRGRRYYGDQRRVARRRVDVPALPVLPRRHHI